MSNKSISELQEFSGTLTGKEWLIISNEDLDGMLVSQKYNLLTLKNEISNDVYCELTSQINDLSLQITQLASTIHALENDAPILEATSSSLAVAPRTLRKTRKIKTILKDINLS